MSKTFRDQYLQDWNITVDRDDIDLHDGFFALVNGEHYRRPLLGPGWILRRVGEGWTIIGSRGIMRS